MKLKNNCSLEESYGQPRQHIKKQRHYFANNNYFVVCLVKAMVFPVVMYGCESWTRKRAKPQRTDVFEFWCCRRLLRVLWTARRSNQSILKKSILNIHQKDWCWSWNYNIWLPDAKSWLIGKDLTMGKFEDRRKRGQHKIKCLDGITDSKDMSLSKFQEMVMDREAWCARVHEVTKSHTWLSDWIDRNSSREVWNLRTTKDDKGTFGGMSMIILLIVTIF